MIKSFCDFCTCEDCRTGARDHLTHAPTEDGRHICDVCWRYDVCVRATRVKLSNGKTGSDGPCEHPDGKPIIDCPHRPRLVGPWTTLAQDPKPS